MKKINVALLDFEELPTEQTSIDDEFKELQESDTPVSSEIISEIKDSVAEFREQTPEEKTNIETDSLVSIEKYITSLENDEYTTPIEIDKVNGVIDFCEKAEDDINYVDNVSVETIARIVALGGGVSHKDVMSLESFNDDKKIALESITGALGDKLKDVMSNVGVYIDTEIKNTKYFYTLLDTQESTLRDLKNKITKVKSSGITEVSFKISDRRYLSIGNGKIVNNFSDLQKEWGRAILAMTKSMDLVTKTTHPVDTKPFFESIGLWNVQKSTIDYYKFLREDIMRSFLDIFGAKKVKTVSNVDYFKSEPMLGNKFVIGSLPNNPIPNIQENKENKEAIDLTNNLSALDARLTDDSPTKATVSFDKVKISDIEKMLDSAIVFNAEQKRFFKWKLKFLSTSSTMFSKKENTADTPMLPKAIRFFFAQLWLNKRFYKFLAENTGRSFLFGRGLVDIAVKTANAAVKS